MRALLRLPLAVGGLTAAVFGIATLTGGWLGTPPWWERSRVVDLQTLPPTDGPFFGWDRDPDGPGFVTAIEPRPGRGWFSAGVVAVGVGLLAVAAWPRRRSRGTAS